MNLNLILIVIIVLAYIIFMLIGRILLNKFSSLEQIFIRNNKRLATILAILKGSFDGSVESLRSFSDLKQTLLIENHPELLENKTIKKIVKEEMRNLRSRSDVKRKEASVYLGMIGGLEVRSALETALAKEKDYSVKIYISNSLTDIKDPASLKVMIDALVGSHRWYRTRAISNILDFGGDVEGHFIAMMDTDKIELIELLVKYACINYTEETKAYLFNFINEFDEIVQKVRKAGEDRAGIFGKYRTDYIEQDMNDLLRLACRTCSDVYYKEFGQTPYINRQNYVVRRNAYWALSKTNSTENFNTLLGRIGEPEFAAFVVSLLTKMIEANPRFLYLVEDALAAEQNPRLRLTLAQVLSNRVEYYVLQLPTKNNQRAQEILSVILKAERVNELIGFINLNKDESLKTHLVELIRQNVEPASKSGMELRTYLDPKFVELCGFSPISQDRTRKVPQKDRNLVRAVIISLLLGFLLIPVTFLIRYASHISISEWLSLLTRYVIEYNYGLIFYSTALALLTTGLMLLSFVNVKKQSRLWNIKNISLLFRNQMIPSISIIAPAFNEEKTIVSSIRSLLNIKYPDFELIVVNDGSHDQTLSRVIETFQLIRTDYFYTPSLATSPILGIYRNQKYPNLVVIDKVNGGKADSLNAGINVANKTYFCGIDSDSVLEPESLLKLASLTLDKSVETPALGGNILPINNCVVNNGQIVEKRIPNNLLARLQTIEYLRAFMIGRLGWQQINSLLIISGAFGLFRKDRVVGIGGYLTSHGKYNKDTVGEDMELVVRISRLLREMKQRFEILYAFNANCWTEVPEDMKSLKNQRYRWQRGLVDIMYFHKSMIFNRHYGLTGVIAMPYYLIFETLGPLFEIQGYILIIVASILGILDTEIALMLFISSVLLGVINSLIALLIAEHEEQYYSLKDLLRLIVLAIVENFGPRQWVSLWRVLGEFNLIFGAGGWGKLKRKGIETR